MNPKILLVDNDAASRVEIADWLAEEYDVHGVEDALDATNELLCQRFDLLILDDSLPVLSGMEFLSLFNAGQESARLPVLVVSAVLDGQRNKIIPPRQALLVKPFDHIQLAHAINSLLALSRAQRSAGQANSSVSPRDGPNPVIGG